MAIWNCDETLKLWFPANPSHVSLSVKKADGSRGYIMVPTSTMFWLVKKYSIRRLPLIKLDVENAEVTIVKDIIARKMRPRQLALEIDDLNFPGVTTMAKVGDLTDALNRYGYSARFFDGEATSCSWIERHPQQKNWLKHDDYYFPLRWVEPAL